MNWLKEKVLNKIIEDTRSHLEKIDNGLFELDKIYYQRKCHINAVQSVLLKETEKVILCIAINKNSIEQDVIVHFINKKSDGKYIDNTWGWTSKFYDYYYIKEIKPDEYDNVGKILEDTKKTYINRYSNGIERVFGNINTNII